MQIRLTVVAPVEAAASHVCDLLVTAPAGTALAAVASALATAVAGGDASSTVLYAGQERLDAQRCLLGEPPLTDGAVLSLGGPVDPGPDPDPAAAQLHVVAGPDAGGVHLLHGGQIRIGRSADADVPLDDPDVSRLHCAVTLAPDGRVTVADLGSTNGTTVDGRPLDERPVRLSPGALLRLGESALRVTAAGAPGPAPLTTAPDGEGQVRVALPAADAPEAGAAAPAPVFDETRHAYGDASWGAAGDAAPGAAQPVVPEQGGAPEAERTRMGTPPRGTELPRAPRKRGGLGRLLRRGGREEQHERYGHGRSDYNYNYGYDDDTEHAIHEPYALRTPQQGEGAAPEPVAGAHATTESWPDAATLLLTALGPGPRLWERGPGNPESLAVRLGTVDRPGPGGAGLLPAVPVTVGLAEAGALGLAGPRSRLAGLARAVVAQLAALHAPDHLELVLISTDRARPEPQRVAEWSWLGWLPHVRPAHGQDCRLLLAYDREQAAARTGELLRRLDDHAAGLHPEPGVATVVLVDGDPGSAALREATTRLASEGAAAGVHLVCLAETPATTPASPVDRTYEAACAQNPAFRACGAVALLSGDVATSLRLHRAAHGQPVGHGTVATVDAVSLAWAERFARALAPLRTEGSGGAPARISTPLPHAARLLDELGLARATPASLMARWAAAADDPESLGGRVWAVLGAGPRGPVGVDLAADGPHLLIEGPAGSGRTELLRSVAASLAAAERPDRLSLVLIDGQGGIGSGTGGASGERGDGLRVCTDLPHVTTHLAANDPVRMREFAQSLSTELKRRAELIGRTHFTEWHTQRTVSGRLVAQRSAPGSAVASGDLEAPPSSTMRLRPGGAREKAEAAPPLPRLVVVVDDLDALLAPPLGSPGRPAAGSVVRALEAVARDGERLGVHLVAAFASGGAVAWTGRPRVVLDAVRGGGPEDPAPGRGRLIGADGRETGVQAGRVTGRIPRTATLRPTVVVLDWARMGDPPDRRPVRELGNGPTDLALLASALERAARSVSAREVPSLL
ncbi:FHA domain-containing protein [Streptomyces sp. VRA16 Mangrove soil]|uniref:FHA domain-containing protein n=1 Tax=Streptomyces sp. VRA16 Mangrove soil TaxID=2817434 RepID=UPI001A9E3C92|nr:FHA domain-containing protein [Streptomyces sp. VRA16 Mangrove soil]MBO1337564.1 FHA domain-containing protein [Streptomyces sp. VRA16 Mangrove soil]